MAALSSSALAAMMYKPESDFETGYPRQLAKSEFECLALNVYHESRGESIKGQEAVAYITLNRSLSENRKYGQSKHICDIIKADKAFSWYNKGFRWAKDRLTYKRIVKLVDRVVETYHVENSPVADATHYVNISAATTRNKWWNSSQMKKVGKIGSHTFFKYRNEQIAMVGK